jgi:hypothetical protein
LSGRRYLRLFPALFAPDPDLIEHARVVERSDAEPAVTEGLVVGGHHRGLHVVEVNLDKTVMHISDNADMVPSVGPRGSLGPLLGDRDPGLSIDQKDAVGGIIGLLAEMNIIKMTRILMAEKQADVAVPVVARR